MKIIKGLTYSEKMQSIALFFAFMIVFGIPIFKLAISYFIIGWILFTLLELNFIKRFKDGLTKEKRILFIVQLLFASLLLVGYFYSNDKQSALKDIIQKLSLILFPLFFSITNIESTKKKELVLKVFIVGNIIAAIICYGNAFYESIEYINGNFLFNPIASQGTRFYYSLFSVFHHPAYSSMYLVFSIAILFWFNDEQKLFNTKKKQILLYLLITFFSVTIFFLSSKAGIFSLVLLVAGRIVIAGFRSKTLFFKLAIIPVFLAGIYIMSTNHRIRKSVEEVKVYFTDSEESVRPPTRIVLWKSALKLSSENIIFGVGNGDVKSVFKKAYSKEKYAEEKVIGFNVHNQFFEILITYGLLGLLIFLFVLIYALIFAVKRKHYLALIFLLLIIFNFLFESMLNTIAGIVFFSFFLNYFIFIYDNQETN